MLVEEEDELLLEEEFPLEEELLLEEVPLDEEWPLDEALAEEEASSPLELDASLSEEPPSLEGMVCWLNSSPEEGEEEELPAGVPQEAMAKIERTSKRRELGFLFMWGLLSLRNVGVESALFLFEGPLWRDVRCFLFLSSGPVASR